MKLNKLLFSIILSGITASLTCAGISAQEEKPFRISMISLLSELVRQV